MTARMGATMGDDIGLLEEAGALEQKPVQPIQNSTERTDIDGIRTAVSYARDPALLAQELYDALYQPDTELCILYFTPDLDFTALGPELKSRFGDANVIGCTTAGEITPDGYNNGSSTGVSIAGADFKSVSYRFDALQTFEMQDGEVATRQLLQDLGAKTENISAANTFGFMLIDGLSMREEVVVSSIHSGLSDFRLFGGSAGDEGKFEQTLIYHDGVFHTDAAVVALIQTAHPFSVFKTQHFIDSDAKLVVTEADPENRIVTEINGEPAGPEYARMVGLEVDKLTPMIFSTYPVIVKIGGQFFVRSIQKVNDDGSLTFFCAIDEGIVLTVAEGVDFIENLEGVFDEVRHDVGEIALVLGCDCILRHIEMDQKTYRDDVSRIMLDNRVVGFSTYGEQIDSMHVNQTFTGVAIGRKT